VNRNSLKQSHQHFQSTRSRARANNTAHESVSSVVNRMLAAADGGEQPGTPPSERAEPALSAAAAAAAGMAGAAAFGAVVASPRNGQVQQMVQQMQQIQAPQSPSQPGRQAHTPGKQHDVSPLRDGALTTRPAGLSPRDSGLAAAQARPLAGFTHPGHGPGGAAPQQPANGPYAAAAALLNAGPQPPALVGACDTTPKPGSSQIAGVIAALQSGGGDPAYARASPRPSAGSVPAAATGSRLMYGMGPSSSHRQQNLATLLEGRDSSAAASANGPLLRCSEAAAGGYNLHHSRTNSDAYVQGGSFMDTELDQYAMECKLKVWKYEGVVDVVGECREGFAGSGPSRKGLAF
jgi:hypothetical protein